MDIVYYHKSCSDGWCAAFVASKRYSEAELVPLDHGAEFDFSQVEGKDVLMVDFSLRTRELNDKLNSLANSFHILDHHKTAQAVLEGAPYATFDMNRSGAGITWDVLFGLEKIDLSVWNPADPFRRLKPEPRPWWVSYTEARDLWRWESLPNSREVCAYLGTLEFTKEAWDSLECIKVELFVDGKPTGEFLESEPLTSEEATALGRGALAHINHYVREAVKQAQVGVLQGYKTAVVNALYLNCSEIGNELAKTHEVSLTWFERHDGFMQFSLRSIGDIDVSAIAKVFNGGGHKNAAGFQLKLEYGRQVLDRILGRNKVYEEERLSGGCVK